MFGMKKESIEVLIDADGNTAIEGQNFKGGMCEKVTSFLEKIGLISSSAFLL